MGQAAVAVVDLMVGAVMVEVVMAAEVMEGAPVVAGMELAVRTVAGETGRVGMVAAAAAEVDGWVADSGMEVKRAPVVLVAVVVAVMEMVVEVMAVVMKGLVVMAVVMGAGAMGMAGWMAAVQKAALVEVLLVVQDRLVQQARSSPQRAYSEHACDSKWLI